MGKEIERKFLVKDDSYKALAERIDEITQAYLSHHHLAVVRLRIINDKAWLTVKSENVGVERGEWEYEIPKHDAESMIKACHIERTVIVKKRYIVPFQGRKWEIDEFDGRHRHLVVAEIELEDSDEQFNLPPFIGDEVTGDPRYFNSSLAASSFD